MYTVATIIDAALRLPSPPKVMAKLLQVIALDDFDMAQISGILDKDQALTAAALRVANSAAYGSRGGRIDTIERALVLLGTSAVMRLVMLQAAACLKPSSVPGYEIPGALMWQKSVRTAIAAEAIASTTRSVQPSLAYTVGLMLDVGKLALGNFLVEHTPAVMSYLRDNPDVSFDALEEKVVGVDHAEVGARMAEAWNFPAPIVTAIRYHHRPSEAPVSTPLLATVHMADILSVMLGASGVDGMHYRADSASQEALALTGGDLEMLMVTVCEGAHSAEAFFQG